MVKDKYLLEEEIDSLEYSCNMIDCAINILKELNLSNSEMLISQCQEILNELENKILDNEEIIDKIDKEELKDIRLERLEKDFTRCINEEIKWE